MEDLLKSSKLGYPVDNADAKYVSGLSTILVATIQEAKDKISQIEYIFCSQLFPNFQSKSKSLQNIYSEARKAAELAWLEKEKELLLQVKRLQFEKQQVLEENLSLNRDRAKFEEAERPSLECINKLQQELNQKVKEVNERKEFQQNMLQLYESKTLEITEYEKLVRELTEKNNILSKNQRSLKLEAEELKSELEKKTREVNHQMQLQDEIYQMGISKDNLIKDQDQNMRRLDDEIANLSDELKGLHKKVEELKQELRERNSEVDRGKQVEKNLIEQIALLGSKLDTSEKLLNDYEMEKRLLTAQIRSLEYDIDGLQKELGNKIEKIEVGRLQAKLFQNTDLNAIEILKVNEVEELEKKKSLLQSQLKGLEEKIDKLQVNLRERSNVVTEGMELHRELVLQIEAKDSELQSEKKKRREVISAYKRLKSQYNFLCTKNGLTTENMLPQIKAEENDSLCNNQNFVTSSDVENKVLDASVVAREPNKCKDDQENIKDVKMVGSNEGTHSDSPSSSSPCVAPKCPTTIKSCPPAGKKRPVSYWRNTRSHQSRGGTDLHDDFLDTPLENIRGNLKKVVKEKVHEPDVVSKDIHFETSDDETQDVNVDHGTQKQQMSPPKPATRGFKYVESVRKKADRENLKGIECKQCKKFYDAVLIDGGLNIDGNMQNMRCEHHDGVSRHRYRYAPPLTPEGFWNIGFESEILE